MSASQGLVDVIHQLPDGQLTIFGQFYLQMK